MGFIKHFQDDYSPSCDDVQIEYVIDDKMKKLISIINRGYSIEIVHVVKRINGEHVIRTIWKATNNGRTYECGWQGYYHTLDCVNNMLNTLK